MTAKAGRSAFSRLLTQLPSAEQRERAHQARRELALGDNDALWGLLHVVHQYCQSLGPSAIARPAALAPAASPVRTVPKWMLVCLGMATQTVVMASSFYVGTRAGASAAPPAGARLAQTIAAIMSVPSGWIVLALALPVLLHVAHSGWLARTSDSPVGWALFSVSSVIAAALLGTIAWMIAK